MNHAARTEIADRILLMTIVQNILAKKSETNLELDKVEQEFSSMAITIQYAS